MRITLEALIALDAIDRRGSFAAAAEELHRVPSAITYTVQKAEQDLGVQLFDRSGHRARLTPAGERMLREGRRLLRAAAELEDGVRRTATGWEAMLTIAVGELYPLKRLLPVVEMFYQAGCGTHIRLSTEVLSGCWDALLAGRADLVVGASGEIPEDRAVSTRHLGNVPFEFVVAAGHPLAGAPEPLKESILIQHRIVAVADSSRDLPPATASILGGQEVLTVPDMAAKCDAQRRGLGVGYAPRHMVSEDLAAGRLVAKTVEGAVPCPPICLAWSGGARGRALDWFLERLVDPTLYEGVVAD